MKRAWEEIVENWSNGVIASRSKIVYVGNLDCQDVSN